MKYFLRSLYYSVIITIILFVLISGYYLVRLGKLELDILVSKGAITTIVYSVFLGLSGSYTAYFLKKLLPGENKLAKRFLYYLLVTQLLAPIIVFLSNYILQVVINKKSFSLFLSQISWANYILPTVIALIIGSLFFLVGYIVEKKNKQVSQQKQIAGQATAQLETLKNQIDPHFLFNSLNVLIGLIEEDKENAIQYTKSLSKIYRYILEQKDKELTSLQEEMIFANSYINLLKLRFENAIQYQEDFVDSEDLKIVPLSLQLLLENCIQHNKVSEEHPLIINIQRKDNRLIVVNNLQEKSTPYQSTRIGLKNIVDRYALLTKEPVEIIKTDDKFTVSLPLLP